MSYVTEAELVEIVPELRALASVETSAEVTGRADPVGEPICRDGARLPESCAQHYGF
jgi:hypothetical protein